MSLTTNTTKQAKQQTIKFAGLTSFDNANFDQELIDHAHARFLGLLNEDEQLEVPEKSLSELIRELPTASTAELSVVNSYDEGQLHPISIANAIINPDKMADAVMSGEASGDELTYAISSEKYTIINPLEAWEPMCEAIDEAGLSGDVIGEFRVYNGGAAVHGDVLFVNESIQLPDRDPLFVGLQTGNSFDGSASLYAAGFMMDGFCRNTTRYLTDKKSRKHTGNPQEHREWWAEILTQMGAMRDYLGEIIEEAIDVELNFIRLPFEPEDFFELLEIPSYLAHQAALDAQSRSQTEGGDRFRLNSWVLHSGLTYALTHTYKGTNETGRLEDYYQTAKEILYNPALIAARVERNYEARLLREAGENEALSADSEKQLASVQRLTTEMSERKDEFERNEERMAALIAAQHGVEGDDE